MAGSWFPMRLQLSQKAQPRIYWTKVLVHTKVSVRRAVTLGRTRESHNSPSVCTSHAAGGTDSTSARRLVWAEEARQELVLRTQ